MTIPAPHSLPIPHLKTAQTGELSILAQSLLASESTIEAWFEQQWQQTPPPFHSSVDLRNAGFKLSPVDTNLFPAGFNNLHADFMPLCAAAARQTIQSAHPSAQRLLLVPESHTRNPFYQESLHRLLSILQLAGFEVRIGSLIETLTEAEHITLKGNKVLTLEPLVRRGNRIGLVDFDPDLIMLNNDLSTGIPAILQNVEQPISPPTQIGWHSRLKSTHFQHYHEVAQAFSQHIGVDPWLIDPLFRQCDDIDFMKRLGQDCLKQQAAELLTEIEAKYKAYQIPHQPYIVIKADTGTYGMGVMMVQSVDELEHLNRKERTRMSHSKGSQPIRQVLIQEGVHSFETWGPNAAAEPVIYMIGAHVVGAFYRVHNQRGINENLNAPGMHFEPLHYAAPDLDSEPEEGKSTIPNHFYAYSVIARLAALAAARELAAIDTPSLVKK